MSRLEQSVGTAAEVVLGMIDIRIQSALIDQHRLSTSSIDPATNNRHLSSLLRIFLPGIRKYSLNPSKPT